MRTHERRQRKKKGIPHGIWFRKKITMEQYPECASVGDGFSFRPQREKCSTKPLQLSPPRVTREPVRQRHKKAFGRCVVFCLSLISFLLCIFCSFYCSLLFCPYVITYLSFVPISFFPLSVFLVNHDKSWDWFGNTFH